MLFKLVLWIYLKLDPSPKYATVQFYSKLYNAVCTVIPNSIAKKKKKRSPKPAHLRTWGPFLHPLHA